jgi:hypothetical protein
MTSVRERVLYELSRRMIKPPNAAMHDMGAYTEWRGDHLAHAWSRFDDQHVTGKDVLDFGSGQGNLAFYLAQNKRPRRMVGVELHGPSVARAQARAAALSLPEGVSLEFLQGRVDGLPGARRALRHPAGLRLHGARHAAPGGAPGLAPGPPAGRAGAPRVVPVPEPVGAPHGGPHPGALGPPDLRPAGHDAHRRAHLRPGRLPAPGPGTSPTTGPRPPTSGGSGRPSGSRATSTSSPSRPSAAWSRRWASPSPAWTATGSGPRRSRPRSARPWPRSPAVGELFTSFCIIELVRR